MIQEPAIAYFSMEIALYNGIPTYSGGLGILAGDMLKSAADLNVPIVAVTLLHEKGYFHQKLDENGNQYEEAVDWDPRKFLEPLQPMVKVEIEERSVKVRAWKYELRGNRGFTVPVYFLDTNLEENDPRDRSLTGHLYGGDMRYRLCQEVVLGRGGIRLLRELGYHAIKKYHINEGHASLLLLDLLDETRLKLQKRETDPETVEAVRRQAVFTTHTPVAAGHDRFPADLARQVLGEREMAHVSSFHGNDGLDMTRLALHLSGYVNAVARKHGEVARAMFPGHAIQSITNGVHSVTWTSAPFQKLFDQYLPGWRQDSFALRHALAIPKEAVWAAHLEAKQALLDLVNQKEKAGMDVPVFTIGFARRAALYKRADLLFHDLERLKKIATEVGPLQIIYAGKAHPQDREAKAVIMKIFQAGQALKNHIKVIYLSNYDMEMGKLLTSGVDLWLNNPIRPLEASGTSGMKACHNGVPQLSILDGWWVEGHMEGVTGWAIAQDGKPSDGDDRERDAGNLYQKLEGVIIPLFYRDRAKYLNIMKHCIALNASFFNTQRMVQEYVTNAYLSL
ncbi:MAG: alpha-glucan family phosphorylase [Nitrospirae bacterium]|nr:alpha-glucan family phosphorylase [Nitrospirota bacterium]